MGNRDREPLEFMVYVPCCHCIMPWGQLGATAGKPCEPYVIDLDADAGTYDLTPPCSKPLRRSRLW